MKTRDISFGIEEQAVGNTHGTFVFFYMHSGGKRNDITYNGRMVVEIDGTGQDSETDSFN